MRGRLGKARADDPRNPGPIPQPASGDCPDSGGGGTDGRIQPSARFGIGCRRGQGGGAGLQCCGTRLQGGGIGFGQGGRAARGQNLVQRLDLRVWARGDRLTRRPEIGRRRAGAKQHQDSRDKKAAGQDHDGSIEALTEGASAVRRGGVAVRTGRRSGR
jgi:hypothetical protein